MPPPKKVPQTDAIFAELKQAHEDAQTSRNTLRVSLDAKAPVKLGPFSRGGHSRTGNAGADHDFEPLGKLGSPPTLLINRVSAARSDRGHGGGSARS